ncbi:hypothetical protein AZI87_06670 [Bdellovibrio bacteriovorus]|uniref:Uncharacterized protein n=1 Tax=Bdellovibrio bacteriovorus TaxID=959 RepID=A0A161PES8_BDEBC|nr:hypothetical protein AZI87_06670 [Bdellovibrio bacteriovorus]
MLVRVKKSQFTSRLGNKQGQAVIEYVLMLVITVSLILMLANQIFKPFGQFVDNYMGKYVACLLEYGELPTLGSDTPSVVDEDSECDKKFQPGTLANGRPPGSGNGNGSSGDGSSSKNNSGSSSSSDGGSGGSGGTYAGSSSRRGGSYMNRGRRPSSGVETGGNSQGGGKVVEIALDNGGNGGFFRASNGGRYVAPQRKRMSVGISGLTEAERKKLEKKADGTGGRIVAGESVKPPPKKILVKKPEIKTTAQEDEPMTIGNFIRYLFIAALVIALVIFIGGQALQMSKSDSG